jgi:cyclopropane fatty-acyl-phospholipid synthase-like methyltransferase
MKQEADMSSDIVEIINRVDRLLSEDDLPDPRMFKIFGPSESRTQFKKIGLISLDNLMRYAALKKNERVLDIGCGIGRVALPLTRYLDETARYQGIDPVSDAVSWCQKNISKNYPNFDFLHVDWQNKMYNRQGTVDPASFKFPWENESFDLIYLFSVFTHVKPEALKNYLFEIKRMLARKGRVFMTMFIVDEDTERQIASQETHRPFFRAVDDYWTDNPEIHESAMAYRKHFVQNLLDEVGLVTNEDFVRGGWRQKGPGQDILVAWNQ